MHRILLVTDQADARKPLKSGLHEAGFALTVLGSAEATKDDLEPPKADLVIADLEQCQVTPGRLCQAIKRNDVFKESPVVALLTEAQLEHLDVSWGVDDYLTLPVSVQRLVQRLKFLLWKLQKVAFKHGLQVGSLTIDFDRYEVRINDAPVDLTYKEFELLKFLSAHPGRVFSREALLDKVWGYDYYGGTRTVDVHIRRLRSKIESGGEIYVATIRNVGYKFTPPDDHHAPPPRRTSKRP